MNIALICYDVKRPILAENEDRSLRRFLEKKGHRVTCPVWHDSETKWSSFDVVILKSPWDYHDHINDFYQWLDLLKSLKVKLLNPYEIITWNSDKHYLQKIERTGKGVIQSIYLEKGEKVNLCGLFSSFGTTQIVIKPCVSASAKNTIRLMIDSFSQEQERINQLLKVQSYIAQPFMNEIFDGEWSLVFFNGKYSHCILKLPSQNDFRVQEHFGGSYKKAKPEDWLIKSAERYVIQFAANTLYARVDGLVVNGSFMLMELELVEPYLFLLSHPKAYEFYYDSLLALTSM